MGTIADKLNLLLNTKAAIKSAIIGKGQTVADSDPFSAYPAKIQAIETGIQLPTLTNPGTAADLLAGKELIDQDGNPLTGTMPSLTAQTITPGVSDQIIAAGRYLSGEVTVAGDSNLVASNIKSGVNIFGVSGTAQISKSYGRVDTSWSVQSDGITLTIPENHTFGELTSMGVKVAVRDTNGEQINFIILKFTNDSIQYYVTPTTSVYYVYSINNISSSQKTIFFGYYHTPAIDPSVSPTMWGYIGV